MEAGEPSSVVPAPDGKGSVFHESLRSQKSYPHGAMYAPMWIALL